MATSRGLGRPSSRGRSIRASKQRIPFASLEGHITLYVDHEPGAGGVPAQIVEIEPEACRWAVCAPSYEAWLRDHVEKLEGGEYVVGDDGILMPRD